MNGWRTQTLGEVCEKITDGTHQTPQYFESGYLFLSSKSVTSGKVDWNKVRYIDEKQHAEMQKRVSPKRGDILLAKNGTTGVAAMVDRDIPFDIYVSLALLRPTACVIPEYLLHFINSPAAKEQFNKRLKGIGVSNLHLNEIREVKIPVPPIEEQRRIVAILDEALACIDKAKANTEKNIQNARELFDSYLNNIFSNPGPDWETVTLPQLSTNLDSVRRPVTKGDRVAGEYPYYGASGIVDYVSEYLFDEDLLLISEDGANLVARTYPIAFSISGKSWVNNHAHVVRFSNKATQRLVEVYLNSISLMDYISGMAQPKLNQAMLNKIPIPLPPRATQEEIFSRIDELESITASLAATYLSKQENLKGASKTILQRAFSGA